MRTLSTLRSFQTFFKQCWQPCTPAPTCGTQKMPYMWYDNAKLLASKITIEPLTNGITMPNLWHVASQRHTCIVSNHSKVAMIPIAQALFSITFVNFFMFVQAMSMWKHFLFVREYVRHHLRLFNLWINLTSLNIRWIRIVSREIYNLEHHIQTMKIIIYLLTIKKIMYIICSSCMKIATVA